MLGSKKTGAPASAAPPAGDGKPVDTIDTLVGQKAVFKGDLEFTGGLRVDGQVKGNVIAREESNSTVVVSENGEIEGNVSVPHVVVNGTINGNIKSGGRVELQSKSRIYGDVHYKAVEMELGASINGNLVCEPTSSAGSGAPRQSPQGEDAAGRPPGGPAPAAAKIG